MSTPSDLEVWVSYLVSYYRRNANFTPFVPTLSCMARQFTERDVERVFSKVSKLMATDSGNWREQLRLHLNK